MKHLLKSTVLAISFTYTLHAENDLASKWRGLVDQASMDSGVVSTSSHIGIFDGVYTMNPKTQFSSGKAGDAAFALYQASAALFGKWATENGAKTSTTNNSNDMMQRIRAADGDYLCLIYRPPTVKGTEGTFSVVYVDASEFAEGIEPKGTKNAEQGGTGQPATRPELESEGRYKPQPESEGRSR